MGRSFDKSGWAALAAGCFMLAVGCAAPFGPAARSAPARSAAPPPPAPTETTGEKRYIIARDLAQRLSVVNVTKKSGNFMKIQVDVKNLTAEPLKFRYRIEWFDRDGQLLKTSGGGFVSWMLRPREVSCIAATAPAPTAADFEIAFLPAAD